jgi:hypothetical protein
MWQQIVKSHRITTKVADIDKCLLVAFKAALVFIPIIAMLIITPLNLIFVAAAAADADADFRCSMKCANFRSEFYAKLYGASIRRSHATPGYRTPDYLTSWEQVHRC